MPVLPDHWKGFAQRGRCLALAIVGLLFTLSHPTSWWLYMTAYYVSQNTWTGWISKCQIVGSFIHHINILAHIPSDGRLLVHPGYGLCIFHPSIHPPTRSSGLSSGPFISIVQWWTNFCSLSGHSLSEGSRLDLVSVRHILCNIPIHDYLVDWCCGLHCPSSNLLFGVRHHFTLFFQGGVGEKT